VLTNSYGCFEPLDRSKAKARIVITPFQTRGIVVSFACSPLNMQCHSQTNDNHIKSLRRKHWDQMNKDRYKKYININHQNMTWQLRKTQLLLNTKKTSQKYTY